MFDVVAMGELLIDFTPAGVSGAGQQLFEQNPGGGPANLLTAVSKLGKKGAFLGMVGQDQFGTFLRKVLRENGVDDRGLKQTTSAPTTLAFVHLDPLGDRSFSFYRKPGADLMIRAEDLDDEIIKNGKIFHFSSLSLTDEPARSATRKAVQFAKEHGLLISFDPNYRPLLWNHIAAAREQIRSVLPYVDIIKVSEEELELITDTADLEKGSAMICEQGIDVVFVTLGPAGCFYRYPPGTGRVDGFTVPTIDTTGAGDAFLGGVLYWLSEMPLDQIRALDRDKFEQIIRFANAVGALTTTKKGGIPALPGLEEVRQLIL
ncbi:fructokinase [Hydrogenispora ethanolica]|uniref:Fructokinase n=1 Tax=Hydrogenispora ethanolica TaxID=1082276 RepID=A0A4V2QGN4_HYDET|nr:carbohydrate kinase [Hydrogenispora ethanolica]TCL76487.1 fructokinase [Hydrogenispora ethanolica]